MQGLGSLDRSFSHSQLRAPEEAALDLDYRVRAWLRRPEPPDPLRLVLQDDRTRSPGGAAFLSDWEFVSTLVTKIAAQHPRAIFLDYGFEFPDLMERLGARISRIRADARARGVALGASDSELAEIENALRVETRFVSALPSAPVVLPIVCGQRGVPLLGRQPDEAPFRPVFGEKAWAMDAGASAIEECSRIAPVVPAFVDSAAGLGFDEFPVDGDGVVRREQMVTRTTLDGRTVVLPGIGPILAARALGLPSGALSLAADGLHLGDRVVPLSPDGSALIDFDGAAGSFLHRSRQGHPLAFSAENVLDDSLPRGALTDKVVLVGDARSMSADVYASPFDHRHALPGVEAIAISTAGLLEPRYPLRRPPLADSAGFLVALLLWVAGVWTGVAFPLRRSLALGLAVPILVLGAGAIAFAAGGVWIDTAYPAAGWVIAVLGAAITRNRLEDAERRFLHEAFTKYLSSHQVDVLLENPSALRLYGEERELSILFADLRGFTSRSERIPASEMVALLNEHLTAMSKVVAKHDGIVDKYIGDCVMAFWGAPIDDPQHALHACRAGLEMLDTLARENARRASQGREQLAIGVGICSGKVVVGNMGSDLRFDYTVIGDAVNLASRLEGLTKESGYGVLLGERTCELLAGALPVDELGPMRVKGKAVAVRVFGLRQSRHGVAGVEASSDATRSRPA